MATVAHDTSPAALLDRFRGRVFAADPGYPEVLLLKVQDETDCEWWFATFYSDFSPSDPDLFLGKTIVAAEVWSGADLRIGFSDGSHLEVHRFPPEPGDDESDDDLETWSLITPEGITLKHGPGGKWTLNSLGHPLSETKYRRDRGPLTSL